MAERETACECGSAAVAKGLCRACYLRSWHAEHPGRRAEYQRRWRERKGDRYNAARRKAAKARTCAAPGCEMVFESAILHRLYCSKTCKKRADNARYRARYQPRRAYVWGRYSDSPTRSQGQAVMSL